MQPRIPLFLATLILASAALATGTGPTLPEKSREHPLDNREPRQDVIERQDESDALPRPPTLEAPPQIPPVEPIEQRPESVPERRGADTGATPRS